MISKLSNVSAAITHTAATIGATTGLTISSTAGFADVESVRFTDAQIVTTNDPDLTTLADNAVTVRHVDCVDDGSRSEATASLTHTASTGGIAITSTAGYVDVESALLLECHRHQR